MSARVLLSAAPLLALLTVRLGAQSHLFPPDGATDLPPDVQPKIAFAAAPTLSGHGKIVIREAGSGSVVETIDTAARLPTQAIGGLGGYEYYPITVSGAEATIHPRNGELAPGRHYEITVEPEVFQLAGKSAPAVPPASWRFTTKKALPRAGSALLTIAANGHGDFCTVQGALDFIPDGNTSPVRLRLTPGIYTEMVFFTNKHGVTLAGDDRERCVIAYANNDKFNSSGGNPYASGGNPSSSSLLAGRRVYHRGVFLAHRTRDFTLTNLTIHNLTPHGGSQAEALIVNGESDARTRLENVHLISFQDTVQLNGQAYVRGSLIEGDVDFMWGTGPCYWSDCTCTAVTSRAYYTQIRNPEGRHGFVYNHCRIDGLPGVQGVYLSRIEPARFPGSEVVFIHCAFGPAVIPVGWQLQRSSDPARVRFLEYGNHGLNGEPLDYAQRQAASRRLAEPNDAALIANYERPAYVLGNGWNP
jgi:pectin methylesterase-like acyl-CoA thioesterase